MHELSSNAHSIDSMRPWVVNSAPIQNKGLHDLGVNVHSIDNMRPNEVKLKVGELSAHHVKLKVGELSAHPMHHQPFGIAEQDSVMCASTTYSPIKMLPQ